MANVHPWFGNVSVQAGPQWTWDFFQQNDVALAQNLTNKPNMSIAEVGWPTVGAAACWWRSSTLIHDCTHRPPRTQAMRTTGLPTPVKRTYSYSSTTSYANQTRWESSISSSSTSMKSGRTNCMVVLKVTGVCSIRSAFLILLLKYPL